MRTISLILMIALSLLANEAHARARRSSATPVPPSCEEPVLGITMQINRTTGYAPGLGGINGSCNGGASKHRGFHACVNTLQSFINGQTRFLQAATQQRTGSSALFGCWAKSSDVLTARQIPQGNNACAMLSMTDHYARSEDIGRRGAGGKVINEAKIDVEVSKLDANYRKLGQRAPASLSCVKRAWAVQNRDNLKKPFRNKRKKA